MLETDCLKTSVLLYIHHTILKIKCQQVALDT